VSLFSRERLPHWLALSEETPRQEFSPDTAQVLTTLAENGAQFFHEIVGRTGLLPSRVEQALAELSAQGWATADSFEGLRALLLPQEKRTPFADQNRKRHHKAVTSVEYAGRWSLLRIPEEISAPTDANAREAAVELFARTLLRRYGVVFRRLLERESLKVSWYELGRVYRRLEARGEIRGGYFVSGVSGEQFALSEAINTLRSLRKTTPKGELIAISGADPLNLLGILAPGSRLAAIAANRMLFRDGLPVATLESGQITLLEGNGHEASAAVQRALQVGSLPPALRLYYSHS